MSTPAVVPDLDELKELSARLMTTLEETVDEKLFRKGRKEALHDSIVPAVSYTTHAYVEACLRE